MLLRRSLPPLVMPPNLPIEVIEVVIDHVDYDASEYETGITLRNFALACRQQIGRAHV